MMCYISMKKLILTLSTICFLCAYTAAQENTGTAEVEIVETVESAEKAATLEENDVNQKPFTHHFAPVLGFSALQTGEKDCILTPSLNFQFMRIKNAGVESAQPDAVIIAAGYSQSRFTEGLGPDEVTTFHGVNLMGNVICGKNTYMAMVSSSGEVPFSDIKTVTGVLLYSRSLVKNENFDFSLGGGLIVADLGIKIQDFDLFFLPFPTFSFTYKNDIISTTLALMGPPSFSLTLLPKAMVRFKGSCNMMGFSSIRDLGFDCALVYYPLYTKASNEMIGISVGVNNSSTGVILRDKTNYKYQYYSVYGEIKATLVTLRVGYNFNGKTYVKDEETGNMYKGIYGSLQAMYMF